MTITGAVLSLTQICGFLFHDTDSFKAAENKFLSAGIARSRGDLAGEGSSSMFTKLVPLPYSSFVLCPLVSVSVAMEERAIQRAERRRKLEEAKQRREEEKLVWTVGKMKNFHTIPVTRNAVLTSKV